MLILFRREALKLWKQQLGSDATYNKLIRVFERAGYKEYADYVRKVFRHRDHSDSDTDDSSSSEDSYPLPQPQTYPNLKPPSPSEFPSSKPLPHEFYSFILSENLPEGEIHNNCTYNYVCIHACCYRLCSVS